MARHIAFLRAVNVGGHVVTMNVLKREFEQLGFDDVDTFIASGNVIFGTRARVMAPIEARIERALRAALGYDVATFIRTESEVAAVARYQPFDPAAMRQALALSVGFLAAPLTASSRTALKALETDVDRFHVHGREIYWMCQKKQSESTFSNAAFERAVKVRSTFRGLNTVLRLAAKLSQPASVKPR